MCTRPRTRIPGLVLALVVLLAATACGGSDNPGADATPTSPETSQSSPTDTETSLSPQEKDKQQAIQAVRDYQKMIDDLGAHPNKKLSKLATVARGQALAQYQRILTQYRVQQKRVEGQSKVTSPRAEYQGSNVFRVHYCLDVSGLDLVDQSGQSVTSPDRLSRVRRTVQVTEENDGFFVTQSDQSGKAQSC